MKEIVEPLLHWYAKNKRDLPWRKSENPYHIWLSEIMLQQTRVEAVKDYYTRFLKCLPKVENLAAVSDDELMKLWQGLGYYNRARNLKKAANIIVERYNGEFPKTYDELLDLPGIGEYTAGAIASIAFHQSVPAVDGNVYRIYTRLMADNSDITQGRVRKKIREAVEQIVPKEDAGSFNQSLMDLGAGVCIPNGMPLCGECPLAKLCQARKKGNVLEFPVKPKKKPRKLEEKTIFLMEYQGSYLIQQRPDKGLLAGLWEFPSQEGKLSLQELMPLLKEWGVDTEHVELLGSGKHIFSHVEWHMLGYLVHLTQIPDDLKDNVVLASLAHIDSKYSIPSAFAVYLRKILPKS